MRQIRAKELEAELRGRVTDAEASEMGRLAVETYGADAWWTLCHPSELDSLGEQARNGCHPDGTWSIGIVVATCPLLIASWPDLLEAKG